MAMHGPLKDEFFKYRKSKTKLTDGSVPGVPYNRFRSHLTHPLGSGNGRHAGYHHDLYMHGNPGEYRPNINAPSVDWNDYETYEPSDVHHIPIHDNQSLRSSNRNNIASTFLGIVPENEQNAGADIHIPKPTPEDIARRFFDLAEALSSLQETLPKEHPDVLNLRNAIGEIINDPVSMSELETLAGNNRQSKLGSGNPYEVDMFEQAAKEYDRQIGLLENSTNTLSQVSMFEQEIMPYVFSSEHLAGQQTLDDIVANEDIGLASETAFVETDMMDAIQQSDGETISDEINRAMEQVTESPLTQEMEPDPWQMQYNQMAQMFNPNYMVPPNPMNPGFVPMGPM